MSVRCPNASGGCAWHGALERQAAHLAVDCAAAVVVCRFAKYGCGVRCRRHDMAAHLERDVVCHLEMCEAKADELTAHLHVLSVSHVVVGSASPSDNHRRKRSDSPGVAGMGAAGAGAGMGASADYPEVNDEDLIMLLTRILFEHGKASVGKLGSLLHSYTNNHGLSAMCKEKFGGLKKFLELHVDIFSIGTDHPFNPTVWLAAALQPKLTNLMQNPSQSQNQPHSHPPHSAVLQQHISAQPQQKQEPLTQLLLLQPHPPPNHASPAPDAAGGAFGSASGASPTRDAAFPASAANGASAALTNDASDVAMSSAVEVLAENLPTKQIVSTEKLSA